MAKNRLISTSTLENKVSTRKKLLVSSSRGCSKSIAATLLGVNVHCLNLAMIPVIFGHIVRIIGTFATPFTEIHDRLWRQQQFV